MGGERSASCAEPGMFDALLRAPLADFTPFLDFKSDGMLLNSTGAEVPLAALLGFEKND